MGGLQSGMDTEAIIQMMMESEMQPVKRLEEKVVELEDDVYAWDMVDSAMAELGSISADLSSYTTWSQKSAETSDETDITATAERLAIPATYDINVTNLAVAHSIQADSIETTSLNASDADTALGLAGTFIINGQEITYEATNTLREIAELINVASASLDSNSTTNPFKAKIIDKTLVLQSGQEGIGNNLAVGETSGTLLKDLNILTSTAVGVDMGTNPISQAFTNIVDAETPLGLDGKFSLNGNTVTVSTTDSLTDIKDLINNTAGTAELTPDNKLKVTFGSFSHDSSGTDNILSALGLAPLNGDDLEIDSAATSSTITELGVSTTSSALNISGSFYVNSTKIAITTTDSLNSIATKLDDAGIPATVSGGALSFDSNVVVTDDSKHSFEALGFTVTGTIAANSVIDTKFGSAVETAPLGLAGDFTIGGSTITVTATDSMTDIMTSINAGPGGAAIVDAGTINAKLQVTGTFNNVTDSDQILSKLVFSYSSTASGAKLSGTKPTTIKVTDVVDETFDLGLSGHFTLGSTVFSVVATDSLEDIQRMIEGDTDRNGAIDGGEVASGYTAVISDEKLVITKGDVSTVTDTDGILAKFGFPSNADYTSMKLSSPSDGTRVADLGFAGVTTATQALNIATDLGVGSPTFQINGSTISVTDADTLTTIKDKIDNLGGLSSSITSTGKLEITATASGGSILITDDSDGVLQRLGITALSEPMNQFTDIVDKNFDLGWTGSFDLDGVTVSVAATDSLEDIRALIDGEVGYEATIKNGSLVIDTDPTGNGTIAYTDDPNGILQKLGLQSTSTAVSKLGITNEFSNLALSGRINIDGTIINLDSDKDDTTNVSTLDELRAAISAVPGYNAEITSDNRLIINEGDLSSISDTDSILQTLGIFDKFTDANETSAEDLEATIDGIDVTANKNQGVSSLIDNVNLTFLATGTSTVTVTNDTETLKTKLTDFIGKYNEVMELTEQLGKVKLTDTGEVSAAGLLQGEFLISDIQSKARTIITSVNESFLGTEFNSLDDIGIYTTGMDNRLTMVDEDKLDDALANHFDEMTTMFRGIEYDDNGEVTERGIMREFDSFIMDMITPLTGRIGLKTETLTSSITLKNTTIAKKTYDMQNYESYLWEHFANMESAMSSIQAGGQYMMQTLGM